MMPAQTVENLEQHLVESLSLMMDANERYDKGRLHHAKTLAVQLRMLVHQTTQSDALLEQLGYRTKWGWVDESDPINPHNLVSTIGPLFAQMTFVGSDGEMEPSYEPVLGRGPGLPGPRHQRFGVWWERKIVKDLYGNEFSRKSIVLAVANQDGGAHVDRKVPRRLEQLKNGASLGLVAAGGPDGASGIGFMANLVPTASPIPPFDSGAGIDLVRKSPVPALIRQFSYELLETAHEKIPDIYARSVAAQ